MDSFLGMPIVAGEKTVGNLYLTNKQGMPEFTVEDQEFVEMLAAHAAVAIQNARLYEQAQSYTQKVERRNRQLAVLERPGRLQASCLWTKCCNRLWMQCGS